MPRLALLIGLAILATSALVPGAQGAETSELKGTWSGTLEPSEGSAAKPEVITVKVNRAETKGTWSISPACHGKLVLESISYGYHHYYRIPAKGVAAGCQAGGVDCLMREGEQMLDVYVSVDGSENSSGLFTRKH